MLRGLAQYRVLRSLGSGAQGEALLALDTRLNRRVCIKLYHLEGRLAARRRAVAEAWLLTRVDSPRTATIYDVVASGERLALVTRYVPGCDLAALLEASSPLPPANAVEIVSDIAAALAALRQARLSHGDLKPANVRIDRRGRAVLIDFGTAAISGQSGAGWSAESLSPEQDRGEAVQLQSDFFALGLLLYRMLLGCHPFYRHATLDRRLLHRGLRDLPVFPDMPAPAGAAVGELLRDLLAADPRRRPATTFLLRERLREIRGLLPAPTAMGALIASLEQRAAQHGPPPRLPARLVRLPLSQRVGAWFRDYWRGGSAGARVLLAGSTGVSLLLLAAALFQPGPCIAVAAPLVVAAADAQVPVTDAHGLHVRLTRILKQQAPRATVLGAGTASDSRPRLSARGLWDVCVARRRLALEIDCAAGQCLLDLRGERAETTRRQQLRLPLETGPRRLDEALLQLVQGHQGLLR